MPRRMAAHGTYRAYLRCKQRPEGPCKECLAAKDARNASRRADNAPEKGHEPRPLAMLPSAIAMDAELAIEYREELLANLKLVKAAMQKVTETDPLKIVPLSKRHSELLAELKAFAGGKPPAAAGSEEGDPFEQFFGPGGTPRRPATAPRT